MALPVGHTPEEVAEALKINPDRIRRLIREGKVGCLRASRAGIRLLDSHIAELIAVLEVPAAPVGPTLANPFGASSRSANRRRRGQVPGAGKTPPERAQSVLG